MIKPEFRRLLWGRSGADLRVISEAVGEIGSW